MSFPRASGVLLHPTSLPGRYGIGDLGQVAYDFVDFLAASRQSLWQVLPLGPTGYGDSPYQCFSAFAGNPLLVSLDDIAEDGLLEAADLANVPDFPAERIDYGPVIEFKSRLLRQAYENCCDHPPENIRNEFSAFCSQAESWLNDYAMYRAIKDAHGGQEWTKWEPYLRDRENNALHFFGENHQREIEAHKFYQFLFFRQWLKLATYANSRGIEIIGDVPIFVAHDSADVWAHRHLFYLDEEGCPTSVAGVPPDYFSETGQLWGNPLYRWDVMQKDGYQWWIDRIRATLSTVDLVRLDHFRGFEKYWAVPAGEKTAINGQWEEGPGDSLFKAIGHALGRLPIIAEDLGFITPEVRALRERFGFPGMRILQFAFGTDPQSDEFKPYSFDRNSVVYTGTHDNETIVGWFTTEGVGDSTRSQAEVDEERKFVLNYLGSDGREIHWDFIRLALSSVANTAIIPLQDVLGTGNEGRMNVPSRESGNWGWRYQAGALTPQLAERLAKMTSLYGRDRERLKVELQTKKLEASDES
jgi:4-alpha-glucanotransferase